MEPKNEVSLATGNEWQHPSGKNGKHQSKAKFPILEVERDDIDIRLAEIRKKPYPNCRKEKKDLEARRRHVVRELAERGETHSMRAKGDQLLRR